MKWLLIKMLEYRIRKHKKYEAKIKEDSTIIAKAYRDMIGSYKDAVLFLNAERGQKLKRVKIEIMKKVIKWSKKHIMLLACGSLIPSIPILLIPGDMVIDPYLLCVQLASTVFLVIAMYGIIRK